MARSASTNSRMRAAGRDHGIEKRFSMWGRIWLPSPSTKRPPRVALEVGGHVGERSSACGRRRSPPTARARAGWCARRPARAAGTGRPGSRCSSRRRSRPPPPAGHRTRRGSDRCGGGRRAASRSATVTPEPAARRSRQRHEASIRYIIREVRAVRTGVRSERCATTTTSRSRPTSTSCTPAARRRLRPPPSARPSAVYVDPDHLRREQATPVRPPAAASSPSAASWPSRTPTSSRSAAGTPVLVARQPDGSVRAFLNSCRHRGTEVVWGDSRRAAPAASPAPTTAGPTAPTAGCSASPPPSASPTSTATPTASSSWPAPSATAWSSWPAGPASPSTSTTFLGPLDAELEAMELGRFVVERTEELTLDANWKLVMDGFMENYHVRFLHKDTLSPYIYSDRISFRPLGRHNRAIHPRKTYDPASHTSPEAFLAQVADLLQHAAQRERGVGRRPLRDLPARSRPGAARPLPRAADAAGRAPSSATRPRSGPQPGDLHRHHRRGGLRRRRSRPSGR